MATPAAKGRIAEPCRAAQGRGAAWRVEEEEEEAQARSGTG
jgi:hypothetical protein